MTKFLDTLTAESVVEALRTQAQVGLCFVDSEFHYLWVNDALAALLGYRADELVGKSVGDVTHPDDVELDERLSSRAFRGEIPHFTTRKRYVRKDGSYVTADLLASVLHDDEGEAMGGFATVVPVAG